MECHQSFAIYFICFTLWTFVKAIDDPCTHYTTFDAGSIGARNEKCQRPSAPFDRVCDFRLSPDWYYLPFDGYLLNTCPSQGMCGTDFPVWINDSLSSESEGIINRTCCIMRGSNCCDGNFTIQVKKCSDKYVYYLPALEECDSVYCINTDQPCVQTTTTTSTTTTVPVTSEPTHVPTQGLLTSLCVGLGLLCCCLIGVIVYLVCTSHSCKKPVRVNVSQKAELYVGNVDMVPPSAPPQYYEIQRTKYTY